MRKKQIFWIAVLSVLVGISGLTLWFKNADNRMWRRIERVQLRIEQEFRDNQSLYKETAANILACAEGGNAQLTYILQQGTLYTAFLGDEKNVVAEDVETEARLIFQRFFGETGFNWASVDAYPETHYAYPEKSCVFRYTIWHGKEVYCWVDLVYSPNWEAYITTDHMVTYLQEGLASKVDENWYIVVQYGY